MYITENIFLHIVKMESSIEMVQEVAKPITLNYTISKGSFQHSHGRSTIDKDDEKK